MKQVTTPTQRTKLSHLFSVSRLKAELCEVASRFPFTVVFIGLLTLFCISEAWDVDWREEMHAAAGISLSLGVLLSLALYQWCEFMQASRRSLLCQIAVVAIVTANFIYLYVRGNYFSLAEGVGYASAYIALVVAIFFVPVLRRSSMKLQWSYSVGVFGAFAMAVLMSIIMSFFTTIVFGTLSMLFQCSPFKVAMTFGILLAGTLPVLVGLRYIPSYDELETEAGGVNKSAISVFCKNVLLPMALCYTLILYVYALKILFTFTLPNGNVCWMVIGLVTACLLIVYGLQGYVCYADTKAATKRLAAVSIRLLPGLLLPLLVLMSVAIFYRIGEYGITARRLYVATFNIWAYITVAYLLFAKLPKLNLVASSFAIVFLLTSIVPHFNYCTMGLRAMQNGLREKLIAAGATKFPLSYNQLVDILNTQPEETAVSIATDIDYLDDWGNHSAVKDIVSHDERISRWRLLDDYTGEPSQYFNISCHDTTAVVIPEGYSTVEYFSNYNSMSFDAENGGYSMPLGKAGNVTVPVDSLVSLGENDMCEPVYVPMENGDVFAITSYSISGNRKDKKHYNISDIRGYLFKK